MTVGKRRSVGRSMSRTTPSARSRNELAGTPERSGRTPVIIMTWLGMVSMTGRDRAFGYHVPPSRRATRFGVSEGSSSSGLMPSVTSTYTRVREGPPGVPAAAGAAAREAPAAADSTTAAPPPPASRRKVRREVVGALIGPPPPLQ